MLICIDVHRENPFERKAYQEFSHFELKLDVYNP